MGLKTHTCVVLLTLLSLSFSKVNEVNLNSFDGSLYFVQVYEDNCQNCNAEEK